MEQIFAWVRNMLCMVCLFQLFLQMIPDERFRCYVKFLGSLLLTILMLQPLLNGTGTWEVFYESWQEHMTVQESREERELELFQKYFQEKESEQSSEEQE